MAGNTRANTRLTKVVHALKKIMLEYTFELQVED